MFAFTSIHRSRFVGFGVGRDFGQRILFHVLRLWAESSNQAQRACVCLHIGTRPSLSRVLKMAEFAPKKKLDLGGPRTDVNGGGSAGVPSNINFLNQKPYSESYYKILNTRKTLPVYEFK